MGIENADFPYATPKINEDDVNIKETKKIRQVNNERKDNLPEKNLKKKKREEKEEEEEERGIEEGKGGKFDETA